VKLVMLALVAGCASAPKPAPLTASWPATPAAYDEAYERWTRRAEDHVDLVQTLSVSATLEGPEFRAAYVRERARLLGLAPEEEASLAAAERAAADTAWEVELLVATSKPDLNDLRKQDKKGSMWHVALIADDGRQVDPISVRADRRLRDDVHRWFPDLGMFYLPYIVKFPKSSADGKPLVAAGARRLALEVAGSMGKVVLVWTAAE